MKRILLSLALLAAALTQTPSASAYACSASVTQPYIDASGYLHIYAEQYCPSGMGLTYQLTQATLQQWSGSAWWGVYSYDNTGGYHLINCGSVKRSFGTTGCGNYAQTCAQHPPYVFYYRTEGYFEWQAGSTNHTYGLDSSTLSISSWDCWEV